MTIDLHSEFLTSEGARTEVLMRLQVREIQRHLDGLDKKVAEDLRVARHELYAQRWGEAQPLFTFERGQRWAEALVELRPMLTGVLGGVAPAFFPASPATNETVEALAAALVDAHGPSELEACRRDARRSSSQGMTRGATVQDLPYWFRHVAAQAGAPTAAIGSLVTAVHRTQRGESVDASGWLTSAETCDPSWFTQIETWRDLVTWAARERSLPDVLDALGRHMAECCGAAYVMGHGEQVDVARPKGVVRAAGKLPTPRRRDAIARLGRHLVKTRMAGREAEWLLEDWHVGTLNLQYKPGIGGLKVPVPHPWVRIRRAMAAQIAEGVSGAEHLYVAADRMCGDPLQTKDEVHVLSWLLCGLAQGGEAELLAELGFRS